MSKGVLITVLWLWFSGICVGAELTVVASIRPLALLAAEVVGEHGRVETILPKGLSPHHYSLKVSDARRLHNAQLIVWIGPELETFLAKLLKSTNSQKSLPLAEIGSLEWPGSHYGSNFADKRTVNSHGSRDYHIWLNPRNGIKIAAAIAQRLGKISPDKKDSFLQRAQRLGERLKKLDAELKRQFQSLTDRGFAVYHDGYGHFVEAYGLNQLAAITPNSERRPGARHLYNIRAQLARRAHCLFVERNYPSQMAEQLAAELELRLLYLDALGAEERTYLRLIGHIAEGFMGCLAKTPHGYHQKMP